MSEIIKTAGRLDAKPTEILQSVGFSCESWVTFCGISELAVAKYCSHNKIEQSLYVYVFSRLTSFQYRLQKLLGSVLWRSKLNVEVAGRVLAPKTSLPENG